MGAQCPRSHRLGRPCERCAEILEQERHPGKRSGGAVAQRSGRVECGGLLASAVEQIRDDGVQPSRGLETGDRRVQEFCRGDLTACDECGLPDRVEPRQFGVH